MKGLKPYSGLIYLLSFTAVSIVATGTWLYALKTVPTPSPGGWLEVAVPHLAGMSIVAFTLIHLLIVLKDCGRRNSVTMQAYALFAAIFADILLSFYGETPARSLIAAVTALLFSYIALLLGVRVRGGVRNRQERQASPLCLCRSAESNRPRR